MSADKAVDLRAEIPTAAAVEVVVGASKESVLVGSKQLFVPEFVDVQDVLCWVREDPSSSMVIQLTFEAIKEDTPLQWRDERRTRRT